TLLPSSNHEVHAGSISRRKIDWLLAAGLLTAGWLLVFARLQADWSINPQYYYGWVVPFLALGLFYFRWLSRPLPSPPARGWMTAVGSAAFLLLLFPVRLVEEANPEWRLILWIHTVLMVCLTLCALASIGGGTWVRHFAFPVCFLLVSVPWPHPFEMRVIQGMMRGVAAITVELVGLLNIPAL